MRSCTRWRFPQDKLALPYMTPTYDEPEFVVRNIWRLYGGWWNGDPAELKPAPAATLATEMVNLVRRSQAATRPSRRTGSQRGPSNRLPPGGNGVPGRTRLTVMFTKCGPPFTANVATKRPPSWPRASIMGAVRESEAKLASEDG